MTIRIFIRDIKSFFSHYKFAMAATVDIVHTMDSQIYENDSAKPRGLHLISRCLADIEGKGLSTWLFLFCFLLFSFRLRKFVEFLGALMENHVQHFLLYGPMDERRCR